MPRPISPCSSSHIWWCPAVLSVEKFWHPPLEVHFVLWTAIILALSFALMPAVKGAIVGLQWALRMHGFDIAARHEVE